MKSIPLKYVILAITFMLSTALLAYSFYQYAKVYKYIRLIDVSINSWNVKVVEGRWWVITNASILNPTEFSFEIFFVSESLYISSYAEENYLFTQILKNVPLSVKANSVLNLIFEVPIPECRETLMLQVGREKKLKAMFDVGVDFPIAGRVRIKFYKTLV